MKESARQQNDTKSGNHEAPTYSNVAKDPQVLENILQGAAKREAASARSSELAARTPKKEETRAKNRPPVLEMTEDGAVERNDIPETKYNREARGEQAIESALQRGREMRDSIQEKVKPFLNGLRTRVSALAKRGWKLLSSFIGAGGEVIDTASEVAKGFGAFGSDLNQHALSGIGRLGKQVVGDMLIEPIANLAKGGIEGINPEILSEASIDKITELEKRVMGLDTSLKNITNPQAREVIADQREKALAEIEAIRNPAHSQRRNARIAASVAMMPVAGMVMAGEAAVAGGKKVKEIGGRAVDAAGNYVADKVVNAAEFAMSKEEKYMAVGDILSKALTGILGKEVKLSYAQAMMLGAAFDAKGMTEGILTKAKEIADDLGLRDIKEIAEGNWEMMKAFMTFGKNPEDWNWLLGELQNANVEAGAEITEAMADVGKQLGSAAWGATKTVGKGAGIAATSFAVGAAAPLAIAGAIVSAPIAGVAYGAVRGKEAWDKVQPSLQEAIDDVLAENLGNISRFSIEAEKRAIEATRRIDASIDITRTALNEIRLKMLGKDVLDTPDVELVQQAMDAQNRLDELEKELATTADKTIEKIA